MPPRLTVEEKARREAAKQKEREVKALEKQTAKAKKELAEMKKAIGTYGTKTKSATGTVTPKTVRAVRAGQTPSGETWKAETTKHTIPVPKDSTELKEEMEELDVTELGEVVVDAKKAGPGKYMTTLDYPSFGGARKSPRRRSLKRKSPKRKSPKRRSPKRRSSKR